MKTYKIEPAGSSKIEATLCAFCQPGQLGETLVRNGCNQSQFALFIANLAVYQIVQKKNDAKNLAQLFDLISACNASAAKQALGNCNIYAEEICAKDKAGNLQPMTLETYWKSIGQAKPATDLSKFI